MRKKKAEEGKQKAPEVFRWKMMRQALRAAEEGVYCWDIQENKIYYTEQCLRMLGWASAELAPNIFTDGQEMIHEEDRPFFANAVKKYLRNPTEAPLRVEVRLMRHEAKGWRWIRVNGLLDCDGRKRPVRLVGVWVDITRRKMSDLHAMEDRDLFRTLINYLPDNIYFKNKESRFVLANEATALKMGVPTPSDLIGCRDTNFFAGEMTEIARREELEIMKTGVPITNRVYCEEWKGGKKSWCKLSKFPWYASDGGVKGIVGITSDVTEIVETQQRYRRLAEEMEGRNKALEKEIGLAREVQLAMQPERIPERKWVDEKKGIRRKAEFYHVYRPSVGVAGDCFHVFPVGDAAVGMLICDVMGHGVRAALIASMLRGLMEEVAGLADTPALLLSSLNRQLYALFERANITMFVTACYVYLDLQRRRCTFAGAGHPSPIAVTRGQVRIPPVPRTAALGLMEMAKYRESDIGLEDGMKVMMYTDGLTEAQGKSGGEYGLKRVMRNLEERAPEHVKEMVQVTLEGMQKFTQSEEQDDDICVLGVEYRES